jgi:hypothetical protein
MSIQDVGSLGAGRMSGLITPRHTGGGPGCGAHRSGLANAEVGGSSPPLPTSLLRCVREVIGDQEGSPPVLARHSALR